MGSPDLTLSPGDILRCTVDRVDADLDACFLNGGAHGVLQLPLEGVPGTTVAKLVPGACVCVQVTSPRRGKHAARASVDIEFSGRASVLVLDGTAITGEPAPASASVFVSRRVPGVRRAELATRLENAFGEDACGLPSMMGAVNGPVRVVLRTAADEMPWEQVLSAVVVQLTEAAAFTVLARADRAPALLMAEKPDADGDASIGAYISVATGAEALDGRRIVLPEGREVVFERTEALWTAAVRGADEASAADGGLPADVEAARAVAEALVEYDVRGVAAVRFCGFMDADAYDAVAAAMVQVFVDDGTRISGDRLCSVVLVER